MPETVAVPSPLSVKDNPDGNAPDSESAAGGKPVVVTVNEPLVPATNCAEAAELMVGRVPMWSRNTCCTLGDTPFAAVIVIG